MVRLWEPSRTGEASLQNLTFAVKIVRYCGLWRTDDDTKTYRKYSFVVTLIFILAYIKLLVFCISAAGDMELFIQSSTIVCGWTPSLMGICVIYTFLGKFTEVVEKMRAFILFVHTGDEQWKYVARGYSTGGKKKLTVYYLASGTISLLSYLLKPVVSHFLFGQEADIPIPQLVMFYDNSMMSFFVQYLAQIVICHSIWAVVMSMDVICFNIILSCSHQLSLLISMILNVVNTKTKKAEFAWENTRSECQLKQMLNSVDYADIAINNSDDIITCPGYFACVPQPIPSSEELRSMEKALTSLSEWHKEILKNAREMANILNAVMLCHYLFTSITICMLIYHVQNFPGQSQLISISSILLFVSLRTVILGWSASELSDQSVLVADAAYSCNWYDLSLSAKKTLIIMMARAQRPVIIKAGPTGSLSLETCKKILEGAYTYLNVLNNMR